MTRSNLDGASLEIATWTPTERLTPLIVDEVVSNCTLATVGGNTEITQTSTASTAYARSNASIHLTTGTEYGIYTKLLNPDDASLATNSNFSVTLSNYNNYNISNSNYVRSEFIKQGDNTWSVSCGNNGDMSTVIYSADVNIHESEICTTFEITNATSAIVTVYVAGVSVATNTVTVADTSVFKSVHIGIDSASATAMKLAVVGTPASPITGVTQLQLTGEVDETAYPVGCADKTYLVTGLSYNLLGITANKVISNGCLVAFDSNGNLVTSTSDANNIEFYCDWTNEEVYIQEGDTTWSDGVTASTSCPGGNLAINTKTTSSVADILTPNGDKLSNYQVSLPNVEVYAQSKWGDPGFTAYWNGTATQGRGTTAIWDNGDISVQVGEAASTLAGMDSGGAFTAAFTAIPARVRIHARK